LLGHTQEDQIETLLLRASHGSGAFGLAGMLPVRFLHPHLALVRPLLSFRRHILQAFLHQQGVRWISDPHNANRLFQRVQIRQALHQVDPRTYQDLCACSRFYAAERRLYARATQRFLQKNATLLGLKVHVDPKAFSLLSLPLRQYILRHILTCVGGKPYPPNEKALQRACTSIASTVSTRITLGRVLLEKRARFLVFSREQRNPPPPLRINPQGFACWDGRFWLENSTSSPCWIAPPMEEEERFPPGILQIVSSVENLFKN
jgi:tRNA(Ile)-lysidine synthase